MDQKGQVLVSFNTDMHIIPDLNLLKNMTVPTPEGNLPVFQVNILPGSDSEVSKLDFGWEAISMSPRELKIQIYFKTALYISSNNEPEVLRLVFNDQFMFFSLDNLPIEFNDQK